MHTCNSNQPARSGDRRCVRWCSLSLLVLLTLLASCGDAPQATRPIIIAQPAFPTATTATAGATGTATSIATAAPQGIQHDEYIFPDGKMYVYAMDRTPRLVRQRDLPTSSGVRGVVGNAAAHRLYISFGSDGDGGGQLLAYDVLTDRILWTQSYAFGIDSMAITPDGRYIFMPDGEKASSPYWYVINTANGQPTGARINGGSGPHNTVISLNGQHVYMGARNFASTPTYLTVANTSGGGAVRNIGPFRAGIRPFVVNGAETLAYVTTTGLLGFQVADIHSGKLLYTVDLTRLGFPNTPTGPSAPSHGIALSPDETRLAVVDWPHNMVHIFDVTGLPASPPRKIADIAFSRSMHHNESNCAYDCAADGWLEYSRDGRFLYVGDVGDVIDTVANRVAYNLPPLYNTRKMIEVDIQAGRCSFIPINRASVGYVTG